MHMTRRGATGAGARLKHRHHQIVLKHRERILQADNRHLQSFRMRRFEEHDETPHRAKSGEGTQAAVFFRFEPPLGLA
jgi:hypothetical protein